MWSPQTLRRKPTGSTLLFRVITMVSGFGGEVAATTSLESSASCE
jgi:hypothetical protein